VQYLVFVFGTLKKDFPNFYLNDGVKVSGCFQTVEQYPLYLVGDRYSPWMMDDAGSGEFVLGELYQVNDQQLNILDRLERVNKSDGYHRASIWITEIGENRRQKASAYLKDTEQLDPAKVQLGPLSEYSLVHAASYRHRPDKRLKREI